MANKNSPDLAQLTVRQLRARRRRWPGGSRSRGVVAGIAAEPATTVRQGRVPLRPGGLHGPYVYLSLGRDAPGARLVYVPEGWPRRLAAGSA